jgi:putative hydrolase of the HAD superfamily
MRAMRIVFDFAGVLFHWNPLRLVQRELPQHAPDAASSATVVQQIFEGYGGDWGDFDRGTIDASSLVSRIAARTGLQPSEVQAVVEAVPAELSPIDDSVALLARLHERGVRQCFLSNMPAPFAAHLERSHAFMRWFDGGIFSSRVHLTKPDPAIFALAAERFGVPAQDLVFIDDHDANVAAARGAGWRSIRFTGAAACATRLERLGVLS